MVQTDRQPRRLPDTIGMGIAITGGATMFGSLVDMGAYVTELTLEARREIPTETRTVNDISLQRGTQITIFEEQGKSVLQMGESRIEFPNVSQERASYVNKKVDESFTVDLSQGHVGRLARNAGIGAAGIIVLFTPLVTNWLLGRRQKHTSPVKV